MSKKVLMLCYYYPPILTVGATRSVAFSRLLPKFGWTPRVLTVKNSKDPWETKGAAVPEGVEIIRTPEWAWGKALNLLHGACNRVIRLFGQSLEKNYFREIFSFPDPQIAWFSTVPGLFFARSTDVLYASCSPFSSALSAILVAKLARKPVVIDFRDAWDYDLGWFYSGFFRKMVPFFERLIVRRCDRLILNTRGALNLYKERYPEQSHKMRYIPNGYDKLSESRKSPNSESFRIVHAGSFYGGRDPLNLLEALTRINSSRIELIHLGQPYPLLEEYQNRIKIRQLGVVPREQAISEMNKASLLYLRQCAGNSIAVAAKTFEYLASGLPVLYHGPEGDNAQMIKEYGTSPLVVTSDSVDEIVEGIESLLNSDQEGSPEVNPLFVERFNRERLTRDLAEVLEESLLR